MKNESGQFYYIELRKRQKFGQNLVKIDQFCCFSDIMGVYYELKEQAGAELCQAQDSLG